MASDPPLDSYHYTPNEELELSISHIFYQNVHTTRPLAASIGHPPPDHEGLMPISGAQAIRILDDSDGNARWTSRDALYLNSEVIGHPSPRLHPAAPSIDDILQQATRRPTWVFGVSPYTLSAPAIRRPDIDEMDAGDLLELLIKNGPEVPDPELWFPSKPLPVPREVPIATTSPDDRSPSVTKNGPTILSSAGSSPHSSNVDPLLLGEPDHPLSPTPDPSQNSIAPRTGQGETMKKFTRQSSTSISKNPRSSPSLEKSSSQPRIFINNRVVELASSSLRDQRRNRKVSRRQQTISRRLNDMTGPNELERNIEDSEPGKEQFGTHPKHPRVGSDDVTDPNEVERIIEISDPEV